MSVTIFTPTYQRAYLLGGLYASLCAQTCGDFTWIVVDDGSTDGTRELVEGFAAEGRIAIEYVYTENGGKQRAWNIAAERSHDELFFNVDSDDVLVPNAVERLLDLWERKGSNEVVGIAALFGKRDDPSKTLSGKRFPEQLEYSTLWDLYTVHGFAGDLALIYRSDLMRAYPYVVDPREKFVSEYTVSYELDAVGPLVLDNTIYCLCEYRADGYTARVRDLTAESPAGYMRFHKQCAELSRRRYDLWYHDALYLVGCALYRERYGERSGGAKELPPGIERALARPSCWLLLHTAFLPARKRKRAERAQSQD